jgi:hypothetical protein
MTRERELTDLEHRALHFVRENPGSTTRDAAEALWPGHRGLIERILVSGTKGAYVWALKGTAEALGL